MPRDPVGRDVRRALDAVGELRDRVVREVVKTPAPGPLRNLLLEVDAMARRVEEEVKGLTSRPFLTFTEAQRLLGVSHQTLYKLMTQGLPSHKLGAKRVFFPEDLMKWIREH